MEYEIKYFRKIFDEISEDIALPERLRADSLRPLLNGVEQEGASNRRFVASTADFLKSKVFSFQSILSYALAFVVIVAVAYAANRQVPDIVDGSIQTAPQAAMAASESFSVGDEVQAEEEADMGGVEAFASPTDPDLPTAGAPAMRASGAVPEAQEAVPESGATEPPVAGGMGGSSEAIRIGKDETYSYLYRFNDETDPDRGDFPITLEIVGNADMALLAQINLADLETIDFCFPQDNSLVLVGSFESSIVSKAYTLSDLTVAEPAELFTSSQPGHILDARVTDGYLHTVTQSQDGELGSLPTERLPDSTSDTACVVTVASLADGSLEQAAYLGADADKRISIQSQNIYISYDVEDEEGNTSLSMAQIKLETGVPEMLLVP